jgi:hypothetical protein
MVFISVAQIVVPGTWLVQRRYADVRSRGCVVALHGFANFFFFDAHTRPSFLPPELQAIIDPRCPRLDLRTAAMDPRHS